MKKKECFSCQHFGQHRKQGEFLGYSCKGDPTGKKWSLDAAGKDDRCGKKKIWFKKTV